MCSGRRYCGDYIMDFFGTPSSPSREPTTPLTFNPSPARNFIAEQRSSWSLLFKARGLKGFLHLDISLNILNFFLLFCPFLIQLLEPLCVGEYSQEPSVESRVKRALFSSHPVAECSHSQPSRLEIGFPASLGKA